MSERATDPSRTMRLRSALLGGYEPAPAEFIARRPYYPWIVVATTCIAAFIGQLDASIVQLALPTLEHEFTAQLCVVSWVAIAYQLAFAATLPIFARLAEIAGRKLMYMTVFALFTVASALCGLASNLAELIACRVLLGRRSDARGQQHRHSGQAGRPRQTGPRDGDFCRGSGGRRQPRSGRRRGIARGIRLALGVLGYGAVRARRCIRRWLVVRERGNSTRTGVSTSAGRCC